MTRSHAEAGAGASGARLAPSVSMTPLVTPRLCCPPVKHPPSEPSQFISVPTKTPDKMGFDEVGGTFPRGRVPGLSLEGPTEALGRRSS